VGGSGLLYKSIGNMQVECHTDAIWAGSLDYRRSTFRYCTFVERNLVTCRSKKQNIVARCTTEAKFRSMAHGICELMWQNIIFTEKDLFEVEPLMIYLLYLNKRPPLADFS
jgi:hypothetical protein